MLGGTLIASAAALSLLRPGERPDVVVSSGDPLVALPWDDVVERRIGRVVVQVPAQWTLDGEPMMLPLDLPGDAKKALIARLLPDCARPVVLRWRDQWRGECLTRAGVRVRGAVVRVDGGWHGLEARYPDRRDSRLAPRVARMLASLRG